MEYPHSKCKTVVGLQTAEQFALTKPRVGTKIVMTWGALNYYGEIRMGERDYHKGLVVMRLISTVDKTTSYLPPTRLGHYDYELRDGWYVVHVFSGKRKIGVFR